MISKIFIEFMFFNKTIYFMKVMTSVKYLLIYIFLIKLLIL
jgi:hypothetical protein